MIKSSGIDLADYDLSDYDLWRMVKMMEISMEYTRSLLNGTPLPVLPGDIEYIYRGKYIEFVIVNGVRSVRLTDKSLAEGEVANTPWR